MTVRTASTTAALISALQASVGGDAIELTGTTYNVLDITGASFSSEVVIYATDPGNKPTFIYNDAITRLDNTNNITIRNVKFVRDWVATDSGDQSNTMRIDNASNLLLEDCEIMGGLNGSGAPIGRGVNDKGAGSGVRFLRCKFHQLFKGYTGNTNQFTIEKCEFTNLRSDGFSLGAQTDVFILYNHFHDFDTVPGSPAHPDMGQIYRNNGIGMNNLQMIGNVLDDGLGNFGQGYFAGDSGQSNGAPYSTVRHKNVVIRDNLFHKDHDNSLALNWCDNLLIENNTLVQSNAGNSSVECRIRVDDTSTDVTIRNNICSEITTIGSPPPAVPGAWTVVNNTLVPTAQIPSNFNVYAATAATDNLILGSQGFTDIYHDFEIKAGTAAHTALNGARIGKREGGWGGAGLTPPPTYQGGFTGGVSAPSLPVGSVAAVISVP